VIIRKLETLRVSVNCQVTSRGRRNEFDTVGASIGACRFLVNACPRNRQAGTDAHSNAPTMSSYAYKRLQRSAGRWSGEKISGISITTTYHPSSSLEPGHKST